ncbi:exodeoxyribonuclease V subunit gamma [Massilia sp. DWR3-1-1]|uniref:exodeoxyribonuclease V subunit gamma n=1 Tax=Massilia sp. DWR3-1-1 TaxID=2804559 RepID=UPI003CEA0873
MSSPVTPGLLILHGNQMELLRAAVFSWMAQHPLAPLEEEIVLVQSNGVAEWLKIALAEQSGVCAATRVALPARFLWEAYRGLLGADQVPKRSPFDKAPLTWRLMRLLPALVNEPVFAPLQHFLGDGDPARRLQLAARLADLFDQYQVYRADWLDDWANERDVLRDGSGQGAIASRPLAADQCWQARLWRAIRASLPAQQRASGRAYVHQRFQDASAAGAAPAGRLPRRVVVFGISALPHQSLQALAALSRYCQVVVAVPNPCQFYWGDIIDGRHLLKAAHRRQGARGADLSHLPIEDMHAHSHPLLASWGRQGRDFIRLLDEFDGAAQGQFGNLRVDLFTEEPGATLLGRVQAAVRDLLPLSEHPLAGQAPTAPAAPDRSVEFHIAHSAQREVEILHDQLLSWFAGDPGLRPRDIVVMVPDIDTFSAAIHAVFDQHRRHEARFIPFEIGDVKDRSVNPLLVALEWLLRLPQQRCRQSEVRDLLDVPALAGRFGLGADDLPIVGRWIEGASVRWGLDQQHRDGLGLGSAGEQNAWIFGVRRMLLGYAVGNGASFDGVEPYAEVGGLDAALAGSLAQLIETLLAYRAVLAEARTPSAWAQCARALLAAFFDGQHDDDRLTLAQLHGALQSWQETCDEAEFDEAVPLAVLREAWLGALDEPTLNHQFVSGGVTFCSLMPMRAVPFRVVCLLGMNDGDFPRRASHNDFDLLALPGMARPGDRSRRDDDRYLMLEALLSARDKLYVSWVGRNVRDNSEQPPSVLVSQLRDYLLAGWAIEPDAITTLHALQPFSRRYFEEGGLRSYAAEWSGAHDGAVPAIAPQPLPPYELEAGYQLKLGELATFVRQPARYFFRRRLDVRFIDDDALGQDEEPFGFDALERYALEDSLLDDSAGDDSGALDDAGASVRAALALRAGRLAREGILPIGLRGQMWQDDLVEALVPVRAAWLRQLARLPERAPKLALSLRFGEVRFDDWIDRLRRRGDETAWLMQISSKVLDKAGNPRADKLIVPWLRQLAAAAVGHPVAGCLVARDAVVEMAPLEQTAALATLTALVALWRRNLDAPLPVACLSSLTWLAGGDPRATYEGGYQMAGEVEREPCLARLWPDFAALSSHSEALPTAEALYAPLLAWIEQDIAVSPLNRPGTMGQS